MFLFQGKLQQYHLKLSSLLSDNEALRQRVRSLESKEAGYEACLDQVASQVVKALLSQKVRIWYISELTHISISCLWCASGSQRRNIIFAFSHQRSRTTESLLDFSHMLPTPTI
jgi:hypothetical protein